MSSIALPLSRRFELADQFFRDIWAAIEGCRNAVAKGPRDVPAVALIALTLEHCSAVAELLHGPWKSSALALLRPMNDAFLRARWLWECASEDQLEKAVERDKFPGNGDMLAALLAGDATRRESAEKLAAFNAAIRDGLHSFTHGGKAQLQGRVHPHGIQGTATEERLGAALTMAMGYAVMAVALLWEIYEDEAFMARCLEILRAAGFQNPEAMEQPGGACPEP